MVKALRSKLVFKTTCDDSGKGTTLVVPPEFEPGLRFSACGWLFALASDRGREKPASAAEAANLIAFGAARLKSCPSRACRSLRFLPILHEREARAYMSAATSSLLWLRDGRR